MSAAEKTLPKSERITTARASEKDTPMAEANALRGGTGKYVPTAAKTIVAKARTARASEE